MHAGSHYDIGRQRFVFTREVPGIGGLIHKLLENTNIVGLNIIYTVELANAPLLWLMERVKAIQPHLLAGPAVHYLDTWRRDDWPAIWHFPWCRPLQIDAYDTLYQRLRTLLPVQQVPQSSSALEGFVSSQVLIDRHIPQAPAGQPVNFYRHPEAEDPTEAFQSFQTACGASTVYISQAFQHFKLVNFRQPAFVRDL